MWGIGFDSWFRFVYFYLLTHSLAFAFGAMKSSFWDSPGFPPGPRCFWFFLTVSLSPSGCFSFTVPHLGHNWYFIVVLYQPWLVPNFTSTTQSPPAIALGESLQMII